ncbi:hypothetical protein V2J09_007872 [Rumex salicifolius]
MILSILLILALCFIATRSFLVVDASGASVVFHALPTTKSTCKGSVGDCMEDEDEFFLDSEVNRRILASKKYISYNALKKNNVPCSRRGASYYNCKSGAQANPYKRGCSKITRCRN